MTTLLLNEFSKEHRKVEEQQATIAELRTNSAKQTVTVAQQQKQIHASHRRVTESDARVEAANPAPRVASDN